MISCSFEKDSTDIHETESMTYTSEYVKCEISNLVSSLGSQNYPTRTREKQCRGWRSRYLFFFGGFFEIFRERLLSLSGERFPPPPTMVMEEEKEEDRRRESLWFWSTDRVAARARARAGTISEAWWLTACPSCLNKNSSPLRHVANTCPALAEASADLFTTCCRPRSRDIPCYFVSVSRNIPRRLEYMARRDETRRQKMIL